MRSRLAAWFTLLILLLSPSAAGQETAQRPNQVGSYGAWLADKVLTESPGRLSLRTGKWKYLDEWRQNARRQALELIAPVDLGATPVVTVTERTTYDGLDIEFLT